MSGVDLLPAWPTSGDSEAAFNTKADALGPALSTMITQINTALGVTNISAWVSGAAYTAGTSVVWSTINLRPYRRKTTSSAGTTDPSLDTTNWAPVDIAVVDASGNVTIPGTQVAIQTGGVERLLITSSGQLLHDHGTDGTTLARFSGASYAVRMQSIGGSGVSIEATDDVESTFQQLWLGGSSVGIKLLGTTYFNLTSSSATVSQPIGLGYGTGSGGAVTQATSKTTAVTLNKPAGQITMNAASLAAGASVTFAVNTSSLGQYDVPVVAIGSVGAGTTYDATVSYVATGVFYITLKNTSGGAPAEAVKINFSIIKGASA